MPVLGAPRDESLASFSAWLAQHPALDPALGDSPAAHGTEPPEWQPADRERFEPLLNSLRRLHRLHPDRDAALHLLGSGYSSALGVAAVPRPAFVRRHAAALGGEEVAEVVHRRATRVRTQVLHAWATVRSTVASRWNRALRTDAAGIALSNAFEPLPSYQELFGSLDYLECQECESIFGPAAYLVDLLRIIDEYVTQPNTGIPAGLAFDTRRPDIAQLPLTCEQALTVVPYLQVVVERLAAAAATYGPVTGDVYQALATAVYPSALPFNLPIAQVRAYLGQLDVLLADVYQAWNVSSPLVTRERLGLSPAQYAAVTTTAADAAHVAPFYGVAAGDVGSLGDAGTFMRQAGMGMPELRTLLYQDLSAGEIAAKVSERFFINGGLAGSDQFLALSTAGEQGPTIANLDVDALDRINRFRRLAAALGATFEELDWALRALAGGPPVIADDPALMSGLAALRATASTLGIDLLTACSLVGPLKTYGAGPGSAAATQFDRVFNAPARLRGQLPYHPTGNLLNPLYTDSLRTWTIGATDPANQQVAGWIGSSVQLGGAPLVQLAQALFPAGASPSTPLQLTVEALSALARHARLLNALRLGVDQYTRLLAMSGVTLAPALTIADVTAIVTNAGWVSQSGLSYATLAYVIDGTASPYVTLPYQPAAVPAWMASIQQLLPGPADPTAPAQLTAAIATLFGTSTEQVAALLAVALPAVTLPVPWVQAFLTPAATPHADPPYLATVQAILQRASQWSVLAAGVGLTPPQLQGVAAAPASYGLPAALTPLTLANVQDLAALPQLTSALGDTTGALLTFAADLASAKVPVATQNADLAAATGWPVAAIASLRATWPGITNAITLVSTLQRAMSLAARLGGTIDFMQRLAGLAALDEGGWTSMQGIAAATQATVAANYDPMSWQGLATQLDSTLHAAQRDALLPFVQWSLARQYADITSARNVYEFLFIDVEMGPVVQTSYIVEALSAAQLYLQRCRLGLEQGVGTLEIPGAWWTWMMNYRVWEANRKVFLYPENYLLPSVRQTKTPLFAALEQDLQQGQVTDDFVEDAYLRYFDGFRQVAKLTPVDCYHCTVNDPVHGPTDTVFLFSRTETSPPQFYYCAQPEGGPWSAWKKVDANIVAKHVTPVYAFDKLFVFWAELTQGTNSAITSGTQGNGAGGGGGGAQSSNSNVWKLTINFTFERHDGTWVTPQALVSQEVAFYNAAGQGQPDPATNPFAALFDMDDLTWHKVYVFKTDSGNLVGPDGRPAHFETISVLYGPSQLSGAAGVPAVMPVPGQDEDQNAFLFRVYDRALDANRMTGAGQVGYLPFNEVARVNINLQPDYLLFPNEFVILSTNGNSAQNPTFRGLVDDLNGGLQVVPSSDVLFDNYSGGTSRQYQRPQPARGLSATAFQSATISADLSNKVFAALGYAHLLDGNNRVVPSCKSADIGLAVGSLALTPDQLAAVRSTVFASMGTLVLLNDVATVNSRLLPVRNQPGWMVFDNGDESFLFSLPDLPTLTGTAPVLAKLDEALAVRRPPVTPASLAVAGIPANVAAQAYTALQQAGLLDAQGVVQQPAAVTNAAVTAALTGLPVESEQVIAVQNVILDTPVVSAGANAFLSDTIDAAASQAIYTQFQTYLLIDGNNRVSTPLVSSSLVDAVMANLVNVQKVITEAQVPEIYRTLTGMPAAVEAAYRDPGSPALAGMFHDVHDYTFATTRTSTGAVELLSRELFIGGVDNVLALSSQQIPPVPVIPFGRLAPNLSALTPPRAIDGAQVDFDGVYGGYYWEVFYHIPMLVAGALSANQQFEAAQRWFQFVFDPTAKEAVVTPAVLSAASAGLIPAALAQQVVSRLQGLMIAGAPVLDAAGRVNPAFSLTTDLSSIELPDPRQEPVVRNVLLNYQMTVPTDHFWRFQPFRNYTPQALVEVLTDRAQIQAYNDYPFDPHAIARLRIGAYEKATVMQYVQNLLAWGDYQFTLDTNESIVAATMLYVYAYDLLGPRPVDLGPRAPRAPKTFAAIREEYQGGGGIPQFLIDLEQMLPEDPYPPRAGDVDAGPFNDINAYFGVPENDQLLTLWDTIDDRLSKIRNSMDINGQVRLLPLFAPEINPMDLVRAAAAGANFLPGAAGASATPIYRFQALVERARALTSQVTDLGGKLLAALEKKDAEQLAVLRNTQEGQLLALTTQVKQQQVADLTAQLAGLQVSLQAATGRSQYYANQVADWVSGGEQTSLDASFAALEFNVLASVLDAASAIGYAVPQVGSPFAMTYGGQQLGHVLTASSTVAKVGAQISEFVAQRSATMAGYVRRRDEWTQQQAQADFDVRNVTQQIAATQARLAAAQQELAIHLRTIAQNAAVEQFLAGKFTNADLYQWMVARIAAVYFQAYQLAASLAVQAQAAYQVELNRNDSFVNFAYWDSLHRGLMAGENLAFSLAQMESAYLQHNSRTLEIERTVSLGLLDPNALWTLQATGSCDFELGEALFDYDYPGHYNRQVKSVSISIPAVLGPYQNLRATLTQVHNAVVTAADAQASGVAYLLDPTGDPPATVRDNWSSSQAVAISRGIDDAGLFTLDFRDERYLPFEGTGAASKWTLAIPKETNRFDLRSIADVIVTVRYTACDGGPAFTTAVKGLLKTSPLDGAIFTRLAQGYAASWRAFMAGHGTEGTQAITFPVSTRALGSFTSLKLTDVYLRVDTAGVAITEGSKPLTIAIPGQAAATPPVTGGLVHVGSLAALQPAFEGDWTITVNLGVLKGDATMKQLLDATGYLDPTKFVNIEAILAYEATVF